MALPTYEGDNAHAGVTATMNRPLPTGWAENDIAVWIAESDWNEPLPAMTGWTDFPGSPVVSGGFSTTLTVRWRRLTASETDPVPIGDSGNHTQGRFCIIRGCRTTGDPFDVTEAGTSTGTSHSIPGDTTAEADCLILLCIATGVPDVADSQHYSGWSNTDLANLLERMDNSTASGNGGSFALATGEKATAGAFGTTAVTCTNGEGTSMLAVALVGAAGGDVTVNPDTGTATLSGNTPTVVHVSSAAAGALTLTGLAPTLVFSAAPAVGTLTLTGLAPTVTITAAAGVGTVTLSGFAPTIDAGGDVTVEPDTGTATLSGFAPTVSITAAAGLGTLAFSGLAPTVVTTSVPGQGALVLTGLAPTVSVSASAGVGTLTFSGLAPSLLYSVSPDTGALSLIGLAPEITDFRQGIFLDPATVNILTLEPHPFGEADPGDPGSGALTLSSVSPGSLDLSTVTPEELELT